MDRASARWIAFVLLATVPATARPIKSRPRFEPTDLELCEPGVLELDLQTGATLGTGMRLHHVTVTDFELSLGLRSNVQLNVDGAISWIRGQGASGLWAGDPLFPSVKLGLYDAHDVENHRALAFGIQLGPRVPTFNSGKGIGYAAIALAGWSQRSTTTVLNAGYVLDPGDTVGSGRPSAILLGLDVSHALDRSERFTLLGELGTVAYVSSGSNEFDVMLGFAWAPEEHVEYSIVGLGGRLPDGDSAAVMLGVSPRIPVW